MTFTLPLPARLDLRIQYRIFPIVLPATRTGTLNAPEAIRGLVDLPRRGNLVASGFSDVPVVEPAAMSAMRQKKPRPASTPRIQAS